MALSTPSLHTTAPPPRTVYYPESDGKPMAETDLHRDLMVSLIAALRRRYLDEPLVYVSGNLLLYYEEGNPKRSTAPDVFVVKGVPTHQRRTYLLWDEGVAPCVAIEISSRSTRREDVRSKPELYARLGIREYFLFDPLEEYLRPPLQGFRLTRAGYDRIRPDADGALVSAELGLRLTRDGQVLRLWYLATGEEVLDDRRRAEAEQARADTEQARADAEHEQAAVERQRADAAEAELARLRKLLKP